MGPAVAGGEGGPVGPVVAVVPNVETRSSGLFMDSIDWREVIEWVVDVILGAVGGTSCNWRFKG